MTNLKYWIANDLYGQAMSQNLPLNGFYLAGNTSQFNR